MFCPARLQIHDPLSEVNDQGSGVREGATLVDCCGNNDNVCDWNAQCTSAAAEGAKLRNSDSIKILFDFLPNI